MLIVERCENPFIAPMMSLIEPTIRRLQAISYRPENYSVEETVEQHVQLINAFREGSVEKVCQQLQAHLSWSLAGFLAPSVSL